jgi:hypothetical protein
LFSASALVAPLAAAQTPVAANPTTWASTFVANHKLPEPLARATWRRNGGTWQLRADTLSVPLGRTTLSAAWRSPSLRVRPGEFFFDTLFAINHEGRTATSLTSTERFRICVRSRCDEWTTLREDGVPVSIRPSVRSVSVAFGPAIGRLVLLWTGRRSVVQVDWQYTQVEYGIDKATTQAFVTAHSA